MTTLSKAGEAAGHTYAAEAASEYLHQASSLLQLLAIAAHASPPDDAESTVTLMEDALELMSRSLREGGEFVDNWLKPKPERGE